MATVKFTKDSIKEYLDSCISHWRARRDSMDKNSSIATYYIDAYQSVRMSIFGELKEAEPDCGIHEQGPIGCGKQCQDCGGNSLTCECN